MSLILYISQKTVIISKYNLEFRFSPPPENLTRAALTTYRLLRKSEDIQIRSNRDERNEVMTLLKRYGQELFNAVIPEHIRSEIYKSGGIFIFSHERTILDIPWELLYDGSSFFALTQGIVRICLPKKERIPTVRNDLKSSLKVSLNAYIPLTIMEPGPRFISHVEDLAEGQITRSPYLNIAVNGNASRVSMVESLNDNPDILFFSGYDAPGGWILERGPEDAKYAVGQWFENDFRKAVSSAIENGLRISILQTSSLLPSANSESIHPVQFLFDSGQPYIISINGKLNDYRLKEYLHIFLMGLIREENLLRAHRLAINHIQGSLPLSWDWSWIQLHVNQKILEIPGEQPLPPFHFRRISGDISPLMPDRGEGRGWLVRRRFFGDYEIIKTCIDLLVSPQAKHPVCLDCSNGQLSEYILNEALRRVASNRAMTVSAMYYQRWGYADENSEKLVSSKYAGLFDFITKEKEIEKQFDHSLLTLKEAGDPEQAVRVLVIRTPPVKSDRLFDNWLLKKEVEGWKIFVLMDDRFSTSLETESMDPGLSEKKQIVHTFEDSIPEEWLPVFDGKLPDPFKDLGLLKIVCGLRDSELISLIGKCSDIKTAWEKTFARVLSTLSSTRMKLFMTLYLTKVPSSKDYLSRLLEIEPIEGDLDFLYEACLIDSDLSSNYFHVPVFVSRRIEQFHLIPETFFKSIGPDILRNQISLLNESSGIRSIQIGFHYCLLTLVETDLAESALKRNLQIGKRLARLNKSGYNYILNIRASLELALKMQVGTLIQQTLLSIVDILEHLPYVEETIAVCNWLLDIETRHRNWTLVSSIQMKIASVYAKSDKKEKAIGMITSAINLNNDIKNYSGRFHHLIMIALLLLDLGEYDKLNKLLLNNKFDIKLLNREDIAKLWLIDGHMLYRNKKTTASENSFSKAFPDLDASVPESLLAKSHFIMAEIHESKDQQAEQVEHLEKSVHFYEGAGDLLQASSIHDELSRIYLEKDAIENAVKHLEWLFHFQKQEGNTEDVRSIADQLGGLYFKIGDQQKSTDFYSIAQGI